MASKTLRALYFEARKAGSCVVGEAALSAWYTAKTLRKWDALESLGLVRLRAKHDDTFDPDDYDCDFGPDPIAYGSIGEYLSPESAAYAIFWPVDFQLAPDDFRWEHADSVWGQVGYADVLDWRENPYIVDVMAETIAAFRDAWKARCPACHGSGRLTA